jgi:hypothetical protein
MKAWEPRFQHITGEPCEVEACNGTTFRGTKLCVYHHQAEIEKLVAKREKDNERSQYRMNKKNWPKEQMRGLFQNANRVCCVCGKSGLHHVREKPKDRKPLNPNSYWEVLEVVCVDCLKAGR